MSKRVLFVDDEPVYVKYYIRELQSAGFEVRMASSVSEASDWMSELSFDLVIVDIMMAPPDRYRRAENRAGLETGIIFLRDLVSVAPRKNVVVLTNVSNPETLDKCRLPPLSVPVFEKPDCSPRKFVREINGLVLKSAAESRGIE